MAPGFARRQSLRPQPRRPARPAHPALRGHPARRKTHAPRVRTILPATDYPSYAQAWDEIANTAYGQFNVDTWAAGRRYLSLTALALTSAEISQLRALTERF